VKKGTSFVGLTTYKTKHTNHFYGREREVENMLSILQKNKFICLTGSEGAGKTSLIQAGLIPRLLNGFNGISGNKWSVCSFRPSSSPLENFAQALSFDQVLTIDNKPNTNDYLSYLEQIKEDGAGSLFSIYKNSELAGRHNLLVVIDQIEDIFHISDQFNAATSSDDDLLFDIVNKTARFKDLPIYFLLSTRTSFLTSLSQYGGLQELISKTQYAIQSLSLSSVSLIINEGFSDIDLQFDTSLMESLHEELKEDTSLLPNFQYLLYQIYNEHIDNKSSLVLTASNITGYDSLKTYLNNQFVQFYHQLDQHKKEEFALFFSAFYSLENFNSKTYRATIDRIKHSGSLNNEVFLDLYGVMQENFQQLAHIVPSLSTQIKTEASFSKWLGTDFLHLNYTTYFKPDHFEDWMRSEATAHWRYREYVQMYRRYLKGETGLLVSPQLDIAVEWLNDKTVTPNWASKFKLPFKEVEDYIIKSKSFQEKQVKQAALKRGKEQRKERIQRRFYISFTIIAIFLMLFAGFKWKDAADSREEAYQEKVIAQELMKENQIISELVKIKAKAPSMLLKLKKIGKEKKNDRELLMHIQGLIKTELLFDSLNSIYRTSYVTDDWMHDLNLTALSLLEGKKDYTETSMLIGDLKTYPILDFSIYNDQYVAFVGKRNKLSIIDLNNKEEIQEINHLRLFKGQIERVLFINKEELLILTDKNELLKLSLATEEISKIHAASKKAPIKDFLYNRVEGLIVIVKEDQVLFKYASGREQTLDHLGNHYTAHYYNSKLYVATTQGVFLVGLDGATDQLKIFEDKSPSFKGLTDLHMKGDFAFIGFENGTVKMYQVDHEQLILKHIFSLDEHIGKITSIYYDDVEEVLYSAAVDNRIFRYDLRIEDEGVDENFSELKGHKSTVWKIDGFKNEKGQQILVTADQKGHLLTWYIDDIDMVKELKILVDSELIKK
jgi:energy-coupling factor transporter ATP-binding protein EcfA2